MPVCLPVDAGDSPYLFGRRRHFDVATTTLLLPLVCYISNKPHVQLMTIRGSGRVYYKIVCMPVASHVVEHNSVFCSAVFIHLHHKFHHIIFFSQALYIRRGADLATLSPRKKRAMSWSEDCHGRPRARTTVSSSTSSSFVLQMHIASNTRDATTIAIDDPDVCQSVCHAGGM